MSDDRPKLTPLVAFIVMSLAVVGYFTGLQSPMNPSEEMSPSTLSEHVGHVEESHSSGIPAATSYSDMAVLTATSVPHTRLDGLKSDFDLLTEVKIEPGEKAAALAMRSRNRAFNGAPPTIPHPIEQLSDASCVACHTQGIKLASLRIPQMSHNFLTNCTQCHVESAPQHMTAVQFRENSFAGLPAPDEGPRSFAGAPPQIPHSTWMRSDCMSCHGYAGLQGIRTTHPWRQNCQQCHAPSATLEQTLLASEPHFLSPPNVNK